MRTFITWCMPTSSPQGGPRIHLEMGWNNPYKWLYKWGSWGYFTPKSVEWHGSLLTTGDRAQPCICKERKVPWPHQEEGSLVFGYIWLLLFGCFLKWWYPQNTPKWSFLVGKPMVVGYHHFRKPPFSDTAVAMSPCLAYFFCETKKSQVWWCHGMPWVMDGRQAS